MIRFSIILAGLMFVSCSSTRITSQWQPSGLPSVTARKILVVSIVQYKDRSIKENMERHLTNDLRSRGYETISSYHEFGPKAFEGLDESAALERLRNKDIDLVLTVVLLDKERERYYYHGYFYYTPFFYYYNNFWGYHMMMNSRVYQPGYYVNDTRYFWESNLYELKTEQLLFSVQTQSFDPSSTESMAHEYGEKISEAIVKSGAIRFGH